MSSKKLSDKLNHDLLGVAKWLHDHKLTLNLDKTKCMLIGGNRKRESKADLTVSILDHSLNNVCNFKYFGIHLSSDFTWTDNKQLLDEVEHDIMNYQNRGLCYLPKPKAEADNTDTRF